MTPAPHDPSTDIDPDFALVQRTLAGDQRAFEMLVIKYQRRIERMVSRMVRDTDLVPDITQEAFIRAYKALGQFRGDSQFYTWLYRIAINTAKKQLMLLQRDPVVTMTALQPDDDDETSERIWEPSRHSADVETPDAVLASKEIAQAVNQAIDALPPELGQAIVLREVEGLSYEDIAQVLNCPIGTVRSRIFRAREAISNKIKPMLERQTGKRW
mgnify:CR=1 FL=1